MSYNREIELRIRLNGFIANRLGLPQADYYANLDQVGFTELKSILGDINNIFTLKTTVAFVEWLSGRLGLDARTREAVLKDVLATKPNANGYDVEIVGPTAVIAEIKCNIPINRGSVYGSAQKDGIANDVAALVEGKSKSSIDAASCLKFMVLLDTPEVRKATDHFIRNMKTHRERMEIVEKDTILASPEKIYVIYIRF